MIWFVTVPELKGEMKLMLHPRHCMLLHSLRFDRPVQVGGFNDVHIDEKLASISPESTSRPSLVPPFDDASEAAVAQQMRKAIRLIIRNA